MCYKIEIIEDNNDTLVNIYFDLLNQNSQIFSFSFLFLFFFFLDFW